MEVRECEKVFIAPIKYQYVKEEMTVGWYWVGVVNGKRVVTNSVEECVEKIIKENKTHGFQLIPKTVEKDSVSEWVLILKTGV